MKSIITYLQLLDRWLHQHIPLLLLFVLILLLRLPNFAEPYWYGDEGIYLTIGNALRHGEVLYAEIIDHKTPIIYYLAMTPTQELFRLLLVGWMLATTAFFHHLAKQMFAKKWMAFLSSLVFVLLTTLPWFEGNIPNGELFVMGWILAGSYCITKTSFFENVKKDKHLKAFSAWKKSDHAWWVAAGMLMSLGILTKVPALFDAVGLLTLVWFGFTQAVVSKFLTKRDTPFTNIIFKPLLGSIRPLTLVGIGLVIPLAASAAYYILRGAGADYLQFGLLYNFHYAGNWQLPFDGAFLIWAFSLPGKVVLLAVLGVFLTIMCRFLSAKFQFAAMWTGLALVASTLSNRPYPHYFLQVFPPFALLLGATIDQVWSVIKTRKLSFFQLVLPLATGSTIIWIGVQVLLLLNFGLYPTLSYYQKYTQLVTGQMSHQDYRDSFNYLMRDNYQAAEIITAAKSEEMFIWGTNPMLYALTGTDPTGRFTVAFHIHDLQVYDETLSNLEATPPEFIVVMKNEAEFPAFAAFLESNYIPNQDFDHFVLWKQQTRL